MIPLKKTRILVQGDPVCDLRLREEARLTISQPKGLVVRELSKKLFEGKIVLAVGDAVFKNLVSEGVEPNLCVIDLKVQRQKIEEPRDLLKNYTILRTKNPQGFITRKAWQTIKKAMKNVSSGQKVAVLVEGEEDLLGFPVAILGPIESFLVYGQPGEGAVIVCIDEDEKKRAIKILEESFECSKTSFQAFSEVNDV